MRSAPELLGVREAHSISAVRGRVVRSRHAEAADEPFDHVRVVDAE